GVGLAGVFAGDGHELVLVARREDRLHALADEIAATGASRPIVLAADLLKPGIARVIGDALTAQGVEPQFLVNNAGFGLVGAASALNHDVIDLNVRALTELSLAFVDSLARHRGGPLNVGSVAGFLRPGPGWRFTRQRKPMFCRFPRLCTVNSSRVEFESPCCVPARCRPSLPIVPVSVKKRSARAF